jgi:hypothetical protein
VCSVGRWSTSTLIIPQRRSPRPATIAASATTMPTTTSGAPLSVGGCPGGCSMENERDGGSCSGTGHLPARRAYRKYASVLSAPVFSAAYERIWCVCTNQRELFGMGLRSVHQVAWQEYLMRKETEGGGALVHGRKALLARQRAGPASTEGTHHTRNTPFKVRSC